MQTIQTINHCVKAVAMTLMLLLLQGATSTVMAQSTTKTTPYVFLSCTAYGGSSTEHPAFLNDNKFAEPQVIVYESEDQQTPITNRFQLTYSIKNGTYHKAETVAQKDYWKDEGFGTTEGTGTTVTSLYGDVETGSIPGTVTIVVTATPTSRYESLFNTATAEYTITLNQETPTVKLSLSDDAWKATAGSTIALPTYTVTYEKATGEHAEQTVTRDITSLFTLTATDITEVSATETSPITITDGIIKTSGVGGTAKVKFTFTPIAGYEKSFSTIEPIERELTITASEKIKPVLVFPEDGDKAYWGTQGKKWLRPTVLDQWGNDITAQVSEGGSTPLWMSWSVAPLPEGQTMHTTEQWYYNAVMKETGEQTLTDDLYRESGPQLWSLDNWYVGGPAFIKGTTRNPSNPYNQYNIAGTAKRTDYSYKVYCKVYPKPYYGGGNETDYSAIYDTTESSYDMHVLARKTKLMITPNPSTYDIGLDSKLSFVHRFRIRAVFTAEVDDPNGSIALKAGESLYLVYSNDPDYNSSTKKVLPMTYSLKFKTGIAKMNNFPWETQHQTLNADGTYANEPVDGETYELYIVGDGANDNWAPNWTIQFLKAEDNPVEFGVYDYNDLYESPDETAYARVSDQTKPIVTVSPSPFVIYTSDTELPSQPEISITDAAGDDISTFTYINTKNETVEGAYTISVADAEGKLPAGITYADGKFSIDNTQLVEGDYTLTVTASVDSEVKTYAGGSATLRIIVKKATATQQRMKWDVVNKQTNSATEYTDYADSEHGKLVFTEGGVLTAGYAIDAVPGLAVQFGRYDETLDDEANTWEARSSTATEDGGKVIVYGDPVTLDNDTHLPTGGTYYILYPRVNGFLTVDAKYAENNYVVLTSEDLSEQEVYQAKADEKGEHQFRYPLYAGTTYYLYNKGITQGTGAYTSEALRLHGLNYTPAFIRQRSDAAAQTRATAYAGSYTSELPMLTERGTTVDQSLVAFGAGGVGKSTTETIDATDYVTVSKNTGAVSPKSLGTAGKFAAGSYQPTTLHKAITTEADRVNVYAVVSSAYKNNVVAVPYYNLLIDEVPTYVMQNLYIPVVGEEVTTTNYPTHITSFFGGWQRADNRPYYDTKGNPLTDSWKTARMDSVGANGRTLDAFAYSSFGSQNAKPEDTNVTYSYSSTDENLTYKVPCRGTYLRFEPKESGLLAVYIIQNGMVAYDGNKENASKSGNDKLKVNPLFITDETGTPVTLTAWQGGDQDKARTTATGAFTQGIVRCSYQNLLDDCTTTGTISSSSEADAVSLLKAVGYIPDEVGEATIGKGDEQVVYDVAQTLDANAVAGSKGYTVISKAYVRYSFQVKAGKTYFVFMNGSKLGNGGFAFVPDDWKATRDLLTATELPTVCLDEKGTADGSLDEFLKEGCTIAANTTCNVKLYHSFNANEWSAICLPVSVNETQFKKTFGDDAWIISLDSVAASETIDDVTYSNVVRLTQHNYHWIVAGRPYFIRPGKDFQMLTDEANNRQYVLLDSVTFEQPTANQFTAARWLMKDSTFSFRGFYEPTNLKAGDYFMGKTTDGTAMLYRATKELQVLGYRAFISLQEGSNARIGTFSVGDLDDDGNRNTTAIHDVFDDFNGDSTTPSGRRGVFNLQGQRVGNTVGDLQQLPAGVYIVNGTKTVKQ